MRPPRGLLAGAVSGILLAGLAACTSGGSDTSAPAAAGSSGAAASGAAGKRARASVAASALPDCPDLPAREPVSGGLPAITLNCLGGGAPVDLGSLRGRPTLVNVWASWCGPCAAEMPHLLAARERLGDRVRFLGVDISDRREAAAAFSRDFGVTYPSVVDPEARIRGPLRVPAPPTTLFVRSDGTIADVHYGPFTSRREVLAAVAENLDVTT